MSLGGLLASAYVWADHNALTLLLAALALPVVGTLAAWLGKGGRTDRYGRLIASVVVGLGLCTLLLAVIALVIAQTGFDRSPLEANVVLLAAPLVCVSLVWALSGWCSRSMNLNRCVALSTLRSSHLPAPQCCGCSRSSADGASCSGVTSASSRSSSCSACTSCADSHVEHSAAAIGRAPIFGAGSGPGLSK